VELLVTTKLAAEAKTYNQAAAADGSPTTQTLFMARESLSGTAPARFARQSAEVKNGGSGCDIW